MVLPLQKAAQFLFGRLWGTGTFGSHLDVLVAVIMTTTVTGLGVQCTTKRAEALEALWGLLLVLLVLLMLLLMQRDLHGRQVQNRRQWQILSTRTATMILTILITTRGPHHGAQFFDGAARLFGLLQGRQLFHERLT